MEDEETLQKIKTKSKVPFLRAINQYKTKIQTQIQEYSKKFKGQENEIENKKKELIYEWTEKVKTSNLCPITPKVLAFEYCIKNKEKKDFKESILLHCEHDGMTQILKEFEIFKDNLSSTTK